MFVATPTAIPVMGQLESQKTKEVNPIAMSATSAGLIVDSLIFAGKVGPGERDEHLTRCQADVNAYSAAMEKAPIRFVSAGIRKVAPAKAEEKTAVVTDPAQAEAIQAYAQFSKETNGDAMGLTQEQFVTAFIATKGGPR